MKRYKIYAIALLTGLFQTACSDMFDKKPLGAYTEDDLTGGTYETEVFSMYADLRGFHLTTGNTAMAIHSYRSEDAEKGSTASDGAATGLMYDDLNTLPATACCKATGQPTTTSSTR